ncbi:hypothetical protein SLE2022_329000 [Rubroshorea leprosula]
MDFGYNSTIAEHNWGGRWLCVVGNASGEGNLGILNLNCECSDAKAMRGGESQASGMVKGGDGSNFRMRKFLRFNNNG